MRLEVLISRLQSILEEAEGSHHCKDGPEVEVYVDGIEVKLDSVDPLRAPGCSCWYGVELNLSSKTPPE